MTSDDRPRFLRVMESLSAIYHIPLTPLMVDGYWDTLEDIPIDDLEEAALEAAREAEHFPKPATLRKIAKPDRGYKPGDGLLTPMPNFTPIADRPRLTGPVGLADCLPPDCLSAGEGIVAWRFQSKVYEPEPMTPEQETARKAALREQLELLRREGKA